MAITSTHLIIVGFLSYNLMISAAGSFTIKPATTSLNISYTVTTTEPTTNITTTALFNTTTNTTTATTTLTPDPTCEIDENHCMIFIDTTNGTQYIDLNPITSALQSESQTDGR